MKAGRAGTALVACVLFGAALPAAAQAPRDDVIWARIASEPIVLDGVLDEPSWAKAESKTILWGVDNGIPGSGWKIESGVNPTDPTAATLKFLVRDNQMYLGVVVPDASVGGSESFNRFDGLLMALKDHAASGAPKGPAEYFYAWWFPSGGGHPQDPQPAGQSPIFFGRWANPFGTLPRSAEQIANWDAVTVVNGISNSDAGVDQGYTIEMRFNLTPMGYDVTQPGGETIEWNVSIYDCDFFWPINGATFSANRVWWQCPWGNQMWYSEVRVRAHPGVTVDFPAAGALPTIQPELFINEIPGAAPVIDGQLTDGIWSDPSVYSFDIRWGDDALRATYPGVGPYRSGQYQPPVSDTTATVFDPADATIKIFHQDSTLYLGFDVRDAFVQSHTELDRWDGFMVHLNEIMERGLDNELLGRRLSFRVNDDGTALAQDYLVTLVQEGGAQVALSLNPGTTVDTMGVPDNGYTAEMSVKLTRLGYPTDLGDRSLFIGIDHLDGDSFIPSILSYGTRTWWFREYEGECCPAWAYLAPDGTVAVDAGATPGRVTRVTAFPNPSSRPVIAYSLPDRAHVVLEIFDVSGRRVEERVLGVQGPGVNEIQVGREDGTGGVYLYRLTVRDPETGAVQAAPSGKIVLLR